MVRPFLQFVGLGTLALIAAQGPVAPKAQEEAQRCSIEGDVTEAVGGRPIPEALVKANGPGDLATAKTDAAGHYTIKDLRSGEFRVTAWKEGYGNGASGDSSPPRRIRLFAGQQVTRIDFQLKKEAVLAGRVLDTNKNPVVGARVYVWGLAFENGRPLYWNRASARTNDLGEYRFAGLTEEPWYLGALNPMLEFRARTPRARTERRARPANVRVFYPNSRSIASSEPIYLRAGEERVGVDLVLPSDETFCVTASVSAVTGMGPVNLHIEEHSPGWWQSIASSSRGGADQMEVCGVPRGSYYAEANTNSNGAVTGYTRVSFDVVDQDVELGRLYPVPGMKIAGKVTVADVKAEDPFPVGITLMLQSSDRRFALMGENAVAEVKAPGDFVIPNAFAGEYWLRYRLPAGYYLKEARAGAQDLRRESFRAGSGELYIVLGWDTASVSGKVLDGDKPIGDATVVLAPVQLPSAGIPHLIRTQVTSQNGQFELTSIAPGEYRLLAFTGLFVGEGENPDLVRRYLTKAIELNLGPREAKSVTFTVLSAR